MLDKGYLVDFTEINMNPYTLSIKNLQVEYANLI